MIWMGLRGVEGAVEGGGWVGFVFFFFFFFFSFSAEGGMGCMDFVHGDLRQRGMNA